MKTTLRQHVSVSPKAEAADTENQEDESLDSNGLQMDRDLDSDAAGVQSEERAHPDATERPDVDEDGQRAAVEEKSDSVTRGRRERWTRTTVFVLLPTAVVLFGAAAGYLKFQQATATADQTARVESIRAASDSTIAILSYKPDTIDKDLGAAADRLTGSFRDSYHSLTTDVVIPGAKEKQITAVASVPAAASVSAHDNHAVVLLFVNQTTTIGADPPTDTASSVRVTLDKIGNRWLISKFEPV